MNVLQALQSKIGLNYPGMDEAATVALIDAGIDADAEYSKALTKQVDICCAGLCLTLATSPNISDDSYQVTQGDRESLLKVRSILLSKYGLSDDSQGYLTDASCQW